MRTFFITGSGGRILIVCESFTIDSRDEFKSIALDGSRREEFSSGNISFNLESISGNLFSNFVSDVSLFLFSICDENQTSNATLRSYEQA